MCLGRFKVCTVIALIALASLLVPGRVAAQVNCTTIDDTDFDVLYVNANLSGYWIESLDPGTDLHLVGYTGLDGAGSGLFNVFVNFSPYVVGSYEDMQSLAYNSNDLPSAFRYCQYGPGTPTPGLPTETLTPSITPTELVFPTETSTNTPTNTPTPNYPALLLEQEQRTFQWLYFALIVLGSMGVLLIAMRR